MVRCADFYEKWKRDPNWCEKSPKAVEQIDHYLALCDEVAEQGADSVAIYKLLPERVARDVVILKAEIRKSVVKNIAGMIKRGEKVSSGDVDTWTGIISNPTSKSDVKKRTMVPKPTPDHGVKEKVSIVQDEDGHVEKRPIEPTKILSPQPSLAAQMKAKDDGFFIPTTPDPAKAKSARMEELAVELLSMYSPTFQTMVNEIVRVRNTPTSHYGVKDAFYFGVQALAEKKP